MKILVLESSLDQMRQYVGAFQEKGIAVLACTQLKEASLMLELHDKSIDLAILRRESDGLKFSATLRKNPSYKDLPIILLSSEWSEEECEKHQQTPEGANAYLKLPLDLSKLFETISAVTGARLGGSEPPPPTANMIQEYSEPTFTVNVKTVTPEVVVPVVSEEEQGSIYVDHSKVAQIEVPSAEPAMAATTTGPLEVLSVKDIPRPDPDVYSQMPYVFAGKPVTATESFVPRGDAVVPGGMAQSPDLETLKHYLMLREQDVVILSSQISDLKAQLERVQDSAILERARAKELEHALEKSRSHQSEQERLQKDLFTQHEKELGELRFQLKMKTDKVRLMELQVEESNREVEKLRERVRADILKIRAREKELENRLEIVKKDSEALLAARESKILELKRRVDVLEFNSDLLQEKLQKEQEKNVQMSANLERVAHALRVAGGALGVSDVVKESSVSEDSRKVS